MANSLNYTEKRQKSRAEFIVVIIVISLIMTLLIELFFSQQEKITDTIFVGLAQSFTSKVNVVHSKWLMVLCIIFFKKTHSRPMPYPTDNVC